MTSPDSSDSDVHDADYDIEAPLSQVNAHRDWQCAETAADVRLNSEEYKNGVKR